MRATSKFLALLCGFAGFIASAGQCQAQEVAPKGAVKGSAVAHTPQSALDVIARAQTVLPVAATGGSVFQGAWKDLPAGLDRRVPVVIFLHGSSGLGLKAIGEWQAWLAGLGIASVAPDSFALPDRLTYTSPIAKNVYEQIHALRASEIGLALAAVRQSSWADTSRLVLAGTSEGAAAVARAGDAELAGRIVFSWSCEDNYFVESHRTQVVPNQPLLNVISSVDPYFSQKNPWLGNAAAKGHCAAALADSKTATIVLIPGAPHTLINLPQVRAVTRVFLEEAFRR
jgi:hypothetical protein